MADPEKTIILITGANSGIGLATTQVLALASPHYHIIMGCRSATKAESALTSLLSLTPPPQGTLSTLLLDVLSHASITAAAAQVASEFGRIDVLLNNAAIGGLTDKDGTDFATRFSTVLATNVTGPALVAEAFRPLLLKSRNPYAIYVGSGQRTLMRNAVHAVQGAEKLRARGGVHAYQVSKAALNMLAVLEWRDYGSEGIKVFVLSPGFVRSNLRGEDEEARSGWGQAGDPLTSGEIVLGVVKGERDADVGCLIHSDGVYPW